MNPAALPSLHPVLLAAGMEQAAPSPPLRQLTDGLMRGDDCAWSGFHRDYGPGIFRHLLAATWGDHALANEALQQTYLRVARHARPCDSAPMFIGWLRVVARSALNDCRRRHRSFRELVDRRRAEPASSGPASADDLEQKMLAALDAALAELDPETRALLEAKYFSGTSVRSLAGQLALSEKAVESRLTRARAELRERLGRALARHE